MAKGFEESLADLEAGAEPGVGPGVGHGATSPDAHPTVAALRERFGEAILHHELHAGDEHVVFVAAERVFEIMRWLKSESAQSYDLLLDVTGVDYGGGRPVQVVYQLWSISHRRMLRVKAELPPAALEIDSVAPIWATADWLERETYDMFGVHFRGHPDLRRILMPEHYAEGHPLRKDFPLRGRFSRAEQTRRALDLDLDDYYTPAELAIVGPAAESEGRAAADSERHEGVAALDHLVPGEVGPAGVVVTPSDVVDNPAKEASGAAGDEERGGSQG